MTATRFTAEDRAAIAVLDRGLLAAMRDTARIAEKAEKAARKEQLKIAKEDAKLFAEFDKAVRKEGRAVDKAREAARKEVIKSIRKQMKEAGIDVSLFA